jgi:hypothetical protein
MSAIAFGGPLAIDCASAPVSVVSDAASYDAIDHSDRQRLGGFDHASGHQDLRCAATADNPRQEPRAPQSGCIPMRTNVSPSFAWSEAMR